MSKRDPFVAGQRLVESGLLAANTEEPLVPRWPEDAEARERGLTVAECANACGLESYDTALPQGWVDLAAKRGWEVRGHFVWSYDSMKLSGAPYPITATGVRIAGEMAAFIPEVR